MSITSYEGLLFGTGGVPLSTRGTSTEDGIRRIRELDLDCMEIEWVRGVNLREEGARSIRKVGEAQSVALSVHAPYFVNLNSEDKEKKIASMERIIVSCRMGEITGARSVVFHPGYYGNSKDAYSVIKDAIKEIADELVREMKRITLRPETTGKPTQFGSLDEILKICEEVEGVLPCVDFAHIHARENGRYNGYEEFSKILKKIERALGREAIENMHIHISGIEYSAKGEKKHLDLQKSDFKFDEWIQVLKDFGVKGMVIIESPNLETDALLLKRLYHGKGIKS
ncbi:MAG: TIM barrel protein [Candidatus Aminicenantia bacterium]